jgi:hypothetical protein
LTGLPKKERIQNEIANLNERSAATRRSSSDLEAKLTSARHTGELALAGVEKFNASSENYANISLDTAARWGLAASLLHEHEFRY